jgi:hypothetical protein
VREYERERVCVCVRERERGREGERENRGGGGRELTKCLDQDVHLHEFTGVAVTNSDKRGGGGRNGGPPKLQRKISQVILRACTYR